MYPFRLRALPLLCGFALAAAPAEAQDGSRQAPASFDRVDHLAWDEGRDAPVFVSGALRAPTSAAPARVAEAFLDESAGWLGVAGRSDFAVTRVDRDDEFNQHHVRVVQEVGGVPVYGAESVVHLDRSGAVYAFGGTVYPEASSVATRPGIGEQAALRAALATLAPDAVLAVDAVAPEERAALALAPTARLVIYPEADDAFRLAYHADLQVAAPDPARWQVFVDAGTGEVFHRFNAIHTAEGHAAVRPAAGLEAAAHAPAAVALGPANGSGVSLFGGTKPLSTEYINGSYRLQDLTRTNGYIRTMDGRNGYSLPGYHFVDSDNYFAATSQKAGVDAHWGAAQTYDYFLNTHGRNSYNGAGISITSTVHHRVNYNNAFWNGSQMVYGDGDGTRFRALVALDIVAHELTHAVTEYSAGLIYQNASGALNEAVSDIFGVMVDRNDWLLGEDSYTPGTSGDALRYLNNPPLGNQPDHYSGRDDSRGVHYNSGIFNKAAYLMADGGTHRGVSVALMGRAKTERVWYRALTRYFTSSTDYTGARSGVLQATADLYGAGGAEYATVQNAFAAVGIGSPAPTPSGPLTASASGPSVIYTGQSGLFRASATGGTPSYTFTWQVKPICSDPDPTPDPPPPPPPPPDPDPDPDPWPDPNPCDPWDPHCQIPVDGTTQDRVASPKAAVSEGTGELLRGPACNQWNYAGSGATLSYSPGANNIPYGTFYMRALARDAANATDYSNVLNVTYSYQAPNPDPDPWPDPNPCDPWDPHCQIPFGADQAGLVADAAPEALTLGTVRPNPFAERAEFSIGVPEAASARIAAYDLLGREVAVLHDGTLPAGWHLATLDGRSLAPGVYVVRAVVGREAVTARVTRVD